MPKRWPPLEYRKARWGSRAAAALEQNRAGGWTVKIRALLAAAGLAAADPGWDAVIEVWWGDFESMQTAWAGPLPEGKASDDDLRKLVDLSRGTWSVVEESGRR